MQSLFEEQWLKLLILFALSVTFIWKKIWPTTHSAIPPNLKTVPIVSGALPFVGHGIAFSKDIVGFISNCYEKYGKIFRIKIFRVDMVVICDRTMNNEFFKATEDKMSLYDVLTRLYFADAFSDEPTSLPRIINVVKKSIAVRYDTFAPKIEHEARKMIARLRTEVSSGKKIDLIKEMTRFVATTSASCFISVELTDQLFAVLLKFTHLLNSVVVLTYFLPKWLLRLLVNPFLARLRKQITSVLSPEIEKYRENLDKSDSLILRAAVDYIDEESGANLTNQEIGDIVVCLLYVSSENTALGLTNTVTDLACNTTYWEKCKREAGLYLGGDSTDIKGLFASPLINACVMESARLNSHIFALNRKPLDKLASIGGYHVGHAETIAMCEPMLMVHASAQEIFSNPKIYNPDRFLGPAKESMAPLSVMTWGAGVHLCPGKMFSIYEIKMALGLILLNFEFELEKGSISKIDYFSPSAFAERKVQASLKVLVEESSSSPQNKGDLANVIVLKNGQKCHYYRGESTTGSQDGWLLRDFISREEQISLYQNIFELSKNSKEHDEIWKIPSDKVYPFAYHNLVYTGESNCPPPTAWYEWAANLWQLLESDKKLVSFSGPEIKGFNSLYAQLYGVGGSMKLHKDEHVSWGISVNLGASTTFVFGGEKILLHSGDVFIADFSQVEHGVEAVHETSMPDWFSKESGIVENFDRVRCSVQIRDISNLSERNFITREEFTKLLK
ncbi:putative lanosterol 14-alpha demethylase [Folsomia candida]|uniref:Lanosterol 14-alpha demethylase n=1 Tax=Folsomia candida TaxID=158441 RepID=A0A226E9J4_FOLCA|nr:putative lanosterol 14-alpha demethylase [Folsomia candida]